VPPGFGRYDATTTMILRPPMAPKKPRYWLVKSEPDVFGFADLAAAPGATTRWDGVRNHQAKLFLRDGMQAGDGVLYYHSNADPSGVAGVAEVVGDAYADPTQFDPASPYFDPKAKPAAPTWFARDLRAVAALSRFVPLAQLKAAGKLASMAVVQRGSRLSVTPVTPLEWREVRRLGGL